MSPELQKAIEERKKLGYAEDKIRQELKDAGYDADSINSVLSQTQSSPSEMVPLPGVIALVNNSINFVKERYDLALVLATPLVLMSLISYLEEVGIITGGVLIISGIAILLSLLVYFYLTLSVLFVVSHHEDREVEFKEALAWSRRNIFKFAWLSILSALVIWGGFVLLIIPGIIMSIYLYLAQYTLTVENKTGFSALGRSHQLVKGAWWQIFGRLAGVTFLFIIFFFIVGLIIGFAGFSLMENPTVLFLIDILAQLFAGIITVCSFHIGTQIYRNRVTQVESGEATKTHNFLYGSLVTLGLLFIVVITAVTVMFATELEELSNQPTPNYEVEASREAAKQRAEELRNLQIEVEE